MPQTIPIVKRLFNAGELSPKVYCRTDIAKWEAGVKTLLNFIPLPQGGVARRPGFEYIAGAKENNTHVKLIPFQFSTTQAYIIEAGNNYMRFYMDGGQILDGNNNAYEVVTTYNTTDLNNLQYIQSYDTLYITHENHAPAKLTRADHNDWTLATITWANSSQPAEWDNNNGWPRTCTFYQDRLVLASTTTLPSRLWFSKTSDYEDLTTGNNEADGMVLNLLSGSSDVIFWLSSAKTILVGTDSGIQSIAASTGSNTALTPLNKRNYKESYYGTGEVLPVRLGDITIHAGNPPSKIRELAYSWESDGFRSSELTVLSDHLLSGYTVKEFAYQQSPYEIVWCRRSDGNLLALTYLQEQEVIAWSRHTSGNVASIATIAGNTETELWAAIHRNINSTIVTYIERMRPYAETSFNNSFYVDSGLITTEGSPVTTVTGLDHLNGNNVSYIADGVCGTGTVANNNLVISAASQITVGLNYLSDLETLPVELELQSGPTTFQTKRITDIQIRCRNSAGGQYGPDANNLTQLMSNTSFTNSAVDNLSVRGGYDHTRSVYIRQQLPLPMNIDAIGMEVEI